METIAKVKTEENISLVKKAYANFLDGNIAAIQDASTEDIVWSSFENDAVPFASTYSGKKGVGQFFLDIGTNIEYQEFAPREFFAVKDKVFVKGYHKGKAKSTGKTFGHEFLMEFTLDEGKLKSFFAWIDTKDEAQAFSKTN